MKEPGDAAFMGGAAVVGIANALLFSAWLGSLASPGTSSSIVVRPDDVTPANVAAALVVVLGGFAAIVAVHEGIHLIAHPGHGSSRNSIVGILPRWMAFYAFYDAEMTRNRFVAVAAAPFVVVSLTPAVVATFLGQPPVWLGIVILVNALCSGADVSAALLVLKEVPRDAVIRHQSWEAYWKPTERA